jgi:hypothetical protein
MTGFMADILSMPPTAVQVTVGPREMRAASAVEICDTRHMHIRSAFLPAIAAVLLLACCASRTGPLAADAWFLLYGLGRRPMPPGARELWAVIDPASDNQGLFFRPWDEESDLTGPAEHRP